MAHMLPTTPLELARIGKRLAESDQAASEKAAQVAAEARVAASRPVKVKKSTKVAALLADLDRLQGHIDKSVGSDLVGYRVLVDEATQKYGRAVLGKKLSKAFGADLIGLWVSNPSKTPAEARQKAARLRADATKAHAMGQADHAEGMLRLAANHDRIAEVLARSQEKH